MCSVIEVPTVIDVFKRTQTIELAEFKYFKNINDNFIPDNFISNKTVGKLNLNCGDSLTTKIDKDSFNSTRPVTTVVELHTCLLKDSDLSFIEGFIKMTSLLIENFQEMGKLFSTFPTNLPTTNNIKFLQCAGWNTLMNTPSPVVDARKFIRLDVVKSIDMSDDAMNVVMEWAVQSFNSTLESLYIYSNNLTRIPSQIEFFGRIENLDMKNNLFPRILSGSLKLTSNSVGFIGLSNCGVQQIESNAFEGRKKTLNFLFFTVQ